MLFFCPPSFPSHRPSFIWSVKCAATVGASCASACCAQSICLHIFQSLFMHMCIVGINIPSVGLSALIRTMCLCATCVHVWIKCACCEFTSGCPSGAAMLCVTSASSLIAPISMWFAASNIRSYVHTGT